MSKRQYLELMGIDVWQKRLPKQATSPVAEALQVPVKAATSGAAVLADVKASLQSQEAKAAAQTDVAPAVAAVPAPASTPSPAPETPREVDPEFFLAFSHFQGLTMVNVYPGGFAAIPGNHQRFFTSLYFSLSARKQVGELQEFRWPMVKSDRISQSKQDAQKVLARHLSQCQRDVLVFGLEAAELLSAEVLTVYSEQASRDRNLVILEDAEVYFRDPLKRRALWRFSGQLRQRLKS